MFRILVVVMIVVPALEIWGLISVSHVIGGWQTFGLILLTGFVGAFLAKLEGRKVWQYAQQQMSIGQFPTESILDGICIFAGGLLLLTPGFITDAVGFLLVLPLTRPIFKRWIRLIIQRMIHQGTSTFIFRKFPPS